MSIRLPIFAAVDKTFGPSATPGSASVAGIESFTFNLPQDTDNVVMKMYQASISGTGTISALFQTSDDGGSTWYDVARTNTYTSANGATSILNGTAEWVSIPVISMGVKTTISGSTSITTGTTPVSVLSVTGKSAASTLGAGQMSGLPILGQFNRIGIIYTGAITTNDGIKVKVMANSQSATA